MRNNFKELNKRLDEREEEIERLNNIINELEKYIKEEQTRLASETSNIYQDSLDNYKLVNEDIYNELDKVLDILKGKK